MMTMPLFFHFELSTVPASSRNPMGCLRMLGGCTLLSRLPSVAMVPLTPVITDSVEAQDGKVRLAKLDTDNQPELAQALGIQSLPTVFTVHNGKAVDQFIGLLGEEEVEAFVQKAASLGEE